MGRIEELLQKRKKSNLLRVLPAVSRRKRGMILFQGKHYIDLSSNDYLGLSSHRKLLQAAQQAMLKFGASASASRLLSGGLNIHHRLEEKLAIFKAKPRALVYNSGYQANLGIISALCQRGDAVFSDRLNHASIVDGIILSGARLFRFQHNDSNHLESLLKRERNKFKQAWIVTESIFSMDGDRCRLAELIQLKERYNCQVFVDEAHATGIFGEHGAGIVEEQGSAKRVDLIMGTFSKALGSFGAYVAGGRPIIDYLINFSRSFIYSTALPPAVIGANLAGLDLVKQEPWRRMKLLANAQFLRSQLQQRGLQTRGSSQIVPLILGPAQKALQFSRRLRDKGYWVFAIRPPTVPRDESRLRFSLTYFHKREMLEELVNDIEEEI